MKRTEHDRIAGDRPSVAAQVCDLIRQRKLAPGDRLPTHDELSVQLGVGLRRLREGLSVLEHQGVIETRNKGGTLVCRPDVEALTEPIGWFLDAEPYALEDLVRARAHLESGAAAEAAERRTARDLLEILDALEQLESRTSARQDDRDQEEAFHLAILRATHNAVLATFGQLVRLQIRRVGALPSRERREAYTREHREIYQAIEQQDAAAARERMFAHIAGQLPAGRASEKKSTKHSGRESR
jgi:GntR family transcriptional repressor for pyruvate dehydrogenase complex